MKRIHMITTILLIVALALSFGTSFASAQEQSIRTPLPSVSAEEESDGIIFGFYGGGITREPATETIVQVSIAHMCEVNDELVLKTVEICGENGIPVKTFDVNETLESVADSYNELKSLSDRFERTADAEIGKEAATLAQEMRSRSFSTAYFTLDLNDLKQDLTLGDRVPIIAKATLIHHAEALVIERSLSVEYQPGLTSSSPEGQPMSILPPLQDLEPGVQHVHTEYSWWDLAYWFRPAPSVEEQAQAAKNAGLSWVIITDHEEMMDAGDWNNAKQDCEDAEMITGIKVMLGEEVGSVDPFSSQGHYLAYDINSYVDADNNCQDMIDDVNSQGGFGYIAHPFNPPDDWADWSATGYTGLEIMNGPTAQASAINKWTEILEDPSARIFAIGNSDAHFPEEVANAYVYCDTGEAVTHSSVYSALENGHSVVTNGPLFAFTIGDAEIGDTTAIGTAAITLDIAWESYLFGALQKIEVYNNEGLVETITDGISGPSGLIHVPVIIPPQTHYFRLKGIFYYDYEAYTNPIWVDYTGPREDFEWGYSGVSLANWEQYGGDVAWSVRKSGSSKAVITTVHKNGTRGGRLYCDGTNTVTASYSQSPAPTYRAFYVRKDNYSYFLTTNAYFYRMVHVTINTNEMLQYYDGSVHNVCQLDDYTWYLIELRNINYSAGTFDIYVDGDPVKLGARTCVSWGFSSPVIYSSGTTSGGHGNVYLDDIY
jgi:hypothetical protein